MTGTDTAVQNRLVALGFVVTVVDDNVVDVFMAEASNVVFISNTCNPASGIANLATSRATIVLSHAGLYDEFGLTQVGDNGMVPGQTTIDIIDPGHPLAAGLSGTVTVLTNPNAIGWGVPENAALVGTLMGVPSRGLDHGSLAHRSTSTPEEMDGGEAEPAQEIRDEHHALSRLRSGDDLPLGRGAALHRLGDVPRALQVFDFGRRRPRGHPLVAGTFAHHCWGVEAEVKRGVGALKFRARSKGEERDVELYPFPLSGFIGL
jgi:hypothetical protein